MAYYFAGNMQAMWDRSSSLVVGTTLAGTFDSGVVAASVSLPALVSASDAQSPYVGMPLVVGGPSVTTKVYGHFEFYNVGNTYSGFNSSNSFFLRVRNSSGQVVFKVASGDVSISGANAFQCFYWSGSAFVEVGPEFYINFTGLNTFDFEFLPGSSGTFELRINGGGVPLVSVSGMNAAVNNTAVVDIGNELTTASYVSQGCLADFDLRGAKIVAQRPTGNGFHVDGTGSFSDVDDIVTVDTTGIGLPAVGNQKSFLHDNLITSGMVIDAVFINSTTAVSGGVVNNLRGIVRRAGTTVATAVVSPSPELGIEQRSVVATVDPTTGLAWTVANFNASEIGVEARA